MGAYVYVTKPSATALARLRHPDGHEEQAWALLYLTYPTARECAK